MSNGELSPSDKPKETERKPVLWLPILQLAISILAIIVAAVSAYHANRSAGTAERAVEEARRQAQVYLYLDFKQRYYEARAQIPRKRQRPKGFDAQFMVKHWEAYDTYWHNVFDEWFATTQLGLGERNLWDEYYALAIRESLSRHYYRESLCYLINDGAWFAKREEFRKALIDLYARGEKSPDLPPCLHSKTREEYKNGAEYNDIREGLERQGIAAMGG